MRKILDKMFGNKRLGILLPLILAAAAYLLFILLGSSENKLNAIISVPFIAAFWFFGVFFVIYIQVKNTACPEWFLNLLELVVTLGAGISAVITVINFVVGGFKDLDFGLCTGLVTYSAVCWAHSKRNKSI